MEELYINKNRGVVNKRTFYPDNASVFTNEWNVSHCKYQSEPKLFWNDDFMKCPFGKFEYYYAKIIHPTLGEAIYGANRNRGYVWRFDSEKDLKSSMSWSFGSQYKDMLKDGYIKICKGHVTYSDK